eukprot:4885111-Ditylum_brightwellii.AAC.1
MDRVGCNRCGELVPQLEGIVYQQGLTNLSLSFRQGGLQCCEQADASRDCRGNALEHAKEVLPFTFETAVLGVGEGSEELVQFVSSVRGEGEQPM